MGCQRITAPHRGVGRMFQRSGGVGGQLERPGKMFASNGLEDGGSRALLGGVDRREWLTGRPMP